MLLNIAFLNVFNGIPIHPKMLSNILNGHHLGEFKHVALKRMGIGFLWISKEQLLFSNSATLGALNALNGILYEYRIFRNGQGMKDSGYNRSCKNFATVKFGTFELLGPSLYSEYHLAVFVLSAFVFNFSDAKTMI